MYVASAIYRGLEFSPVLKPSSTLLSLHSIFNTWCLPHSAHTCIRNTCNNSVRGVEQNWHHSETRGDTNGTDYLEQKITWLIVLQLLLLNMQGQGVERILMHKFKFSYCTWTCFGTELTWLIWGRRWEDCCTHNAAAEIIACIWQTLDVLPNHRSTSLCRFLSFNSGLAYWRVEKVMSILDKRKCQL